MTGDRAIEVLGIGAGATVQDRGRPGYAALGVSQSGAFDPAGAALANRLVGNAESAAVIETVLGGLSIRVRRAASVALVGAPSPLRSEPRTAGLAWGAAMTLPAGSVLHVGSPPIGLRAWLAVRGGIDVPRTLGSRSTDTLGGLGPAPLRAGDVLAIGREEHGEVAGVDHTGAPPLREAIPVAPGPRADWIDAASRGRLWTAEWTVRPDSNRVGIRLDGPRLRWTGDDQLPSEGVLPGAIQIPPDGRPIVFGPDAPTTGGYPVVGVVPARGLAMLAQVRPGDPVRLTPV